MFAGDRMVPGGRIIHKEPSGDRDLVSLHELLSGLEWGEGVPLYELEFLIIDRGSEDDRRLLSAPEVTGRDRSYLHLEGGGRVPYHRVLEVRREGKVLWRRRVDDQEGGAQ